MEYSVEKNSGKLRKDDDIVQFIPKTSPGNKRLSQCPMPTSFSDWGRYDASSSNSLPSDRYKQSKRLDRKRCIVSNTHCSACNRISKCALDKSTGADVSAASVTISVSRAVDAFDAISGAIDTGKQYSPA